MTDEVRNLSKKKEAGFAFATIGLHICTTAMYKRLCKLLGVAADKVWNLWWSARAEEAQRAWVMVHGSLVSNLDLLVGVHQKLLPEPFM